jgi:hypothetical protein
MQIKAAKPVDSEVAGIEWLASLLANAMKFGARR